MIIDVAELKKQIVSVRSIAEIPTTLRTKLIETGLARAVAYGVDLPKELVGNPVSYFASNATDAKQALAVINETNVINISRILSLATIIWQARYNMVYLPATRESMELTHQVLSDQREWLFDAEQQDFLSATIGDGTVQDSLKLALLTFTCPAVINPNQVAPVTTADEE
ncbi:hypothetical protein RAY_287 [Erwinia phage vB_EamM_RAY]|uniref:Uncharacterized protein n=4 Tax=Agricanvirus TaxID=1984776 RepID=A0A173GEJ4_9CAUD|nr:hypothetical protein FDH98_gp231 [Erwinia phage vB_EamM_RAY]YP_009606396.1 hypothetical protein FDI00_gp290 [Erwinia phage vB_EamM_Special G]AUG86717.1 hypothetical protein MADMEL_290 [Erwinia phage vB_EamM_MadMel]QBP07394.1 hypothetical protein REBECCA_289 [Erwinia phage Rebecca]ANH52067.1 hypothetical protein RAY_287 [Erwinia phage vB_EamM_RAY]ANJ65102.1 hypothetical protein SPECIALG_291 [Erwinia phage vB_EamM_Special G]